MAVRGLTIGQLTLMILSTHVNEELVIVKERTFFGLYILGGVPSQVLNVLNSFPKAHVKIRTRF